MTVIVPCSIVDVSMKTPVITAFDSPITITVVDSSSSTITLTNISNSTVTLVDEQA
jgi:hypothetical protein